MWCLWTSERHDEQYVELGPILGHPLNRALSYRCSLHYLAAFHVSFRANAPNLGNNNHIQQQTKKKMNINRFDLWHLFFFTTPISPFCVYVYFSRRHRIKNTHETSLYSLIRVQFSFFCYFSVMFVCDTKW